MLPRTWATYLADSASSSVRRGQIILPDLQNCWNDECDHVRKVQHLAARTEKKKKKRKIHLIKNTFHSMENPSEKKRQPKHFTQSWILLVMGGLIAYKAPLNSCFCSELFPNTKLNLSSNFQLFITIISTLKSKQSKDVGVLLLWWGPSGVAQQNSLCWQLHPASVLSSTTATRHLWPQTTAVWLVQ